MRASFWRVSLVSLLGALLVACSSSVPLGLSAGTSTLPVSEPQQTRYTTLATVKTSKPWGVAHDGNGNLYIADTGNNRIQKYDRNGRYLSAWGSRGTGNGQFNMPTGLAVDPGGNVYVADYFNHRIQKFNSTGSFLGKWGSLGADTGKFNLPTALATDSSGSVYVSDTQNHRVQVFSSTGTYVDSWGSIGKGEGQFNSPYGVAIDAADHVYVADLGNNRIQKFNSTGAFLSSWGGVGTGDGQFNGPWAVTVSYNQDVFVSDLSNNRIQVFTSTGTFRSTLGQFGAGPNQFNAPCGLTVDGRGTLYVADVLNSRIQRIDPSYAYVRQVGEYGRKEDYQFRKLLGAAIDSSGNIYAPDMGSVKKFSPTGAFLFGFMGSDVDPGQFWWPVGIAIDNDEKIYVVTNKNWVNRFNSDGTFHSRLMGKPGARYFAVAVDAAGNVYAAQNKGIDKFDAAGDCTTAVDTRGVDPQLVPRGIGGVAVDSRGCIYVTDTAGRRVFKYSAAGARLAVWGDTYCQGDCLYSPLGIAVDKQDHVYVVEAGGHRFRKYTSTGELLAKVGTFGSWGGAFISPVGVAVDSAGNVVVADTENCRIQVMRQDYR